MKSTENATKARIEQGEKTSRKLITLIKKSKDGLTIYDLHKKTGLSAGACFKGLQRSGVALEMAIDITDGVNIRKKYSVKR